MTGQNENEGMRFNLELTCEGNERQSLECQEKREKLTVLVQREIHISTRILESPSSIFLELVFAELIVVSLTLKAYE